MIPDEKENLILDRYKSYLDDEKFIGVITVETGGKWKMIYRPHFRNDIKVNQIILNMMIK